MATPDDPNGSTWKTRGSAAGSPSAARLPCLTIVNHANVSRVGERALLTTLRVGGVARVSRTETLFAGSDTPTDALPLGDRYLTRTPIEIRRAPNGDLRVRSGHPDARLAGTPLTEERTVTRGELERGLLLELQDRVALWLHATSGGSQTPVPGLLGTSDAIENVRRTLAQAAQLLVPVLIRGESGTGKELVARALHDLGPRADAPFVSVNMATLFGSTAVSTLFGHERGAFTGAQRAHQGLFERASSGTLFLDEIGETPGEVQPMLLRTLETQSVQPLGSMQERSVDARIIAATDADLEASTQANGFRRALYHRLSAFEIRLPPLRDRPADIGSLFVRFLREELHPEDAHLLDHDPHAYAPPLTNDVVARLLAAEWRGNVRELRNWARRTAVASRGAERLVCEPPGHVDAESPDENTTRPSSLPPRSVEVENDVLVRALEDNLWSVSRTAAALGLPTSTVYDLMARCPDVRKAKDIPRREIEEALAVCNGNTRQTARALRVSERALKISMRERGMLPPRERSVGHFDS